MEVYVEDVRGVRWYECVKVDENATDVEYNGGLGKNATRVGMRWDSNATGVLGAMRRAEE